MKQLFVTLRVVEEAAEKSLPLLRQAIAVHHAPVKCRRLLDLVQSKLHRACEMFERSQFVDDEAGMYVKLFDALSYVTQANRSFQIQRRDLERAEELLAGLAHEGRRHG